MGEVGEDHLSKAGRLIGDGLGHHRVTVAMQGDPLAADGVDQGNGPCLAHAAGLLPRQITRCGSGAAEAIWVNGGQRLGCRD